MQLNEVELWALLELLEPEGWNTAEYRRFYQDEPTDLAEWKYRRDLWHKTHPPDTGDFLLASDNDNYIASQLKDPDALQVTLDTMQRSAPARRLMSRHTRELLRQYRRQGLLDMRNCSELVGGIGSKRFGDGLRDGLWLCHITGMDSEIDLSTADRDGNCSDLVGELVQRGSGMACARGCGYVI